MARRADMFGSRGAWLAACRGSGRAAATSVLLGIVWIYRRTISPLLGRRCRFEPTCSEYFRRAVVKYGPLRGSLRGLARICRCHPWHPGGIDLP